MKNSEREDIDMLLAKHFAKEPLTESQNTVLGKWIKANKGEYEKLKKLLLAPVKPYYEHSFDVRKAWRKIEGRLEPKVVKVDYRKLFIKYVSVAASVAVALIIAVTYFFVKPDSDLIHYANNGTSSEKIILPDGSEVILYPNSTMAFLDGDVRNADLDGKAFFLVRKDNGRAFKVKTHDLVVEVLGTSFLVDTGKDKTCGVFVRSGKVRVSSDMESVTLTANEKVELKSGRIERGLIEDPDLFFEIGDFFIILRNTSLSKAVQEIESRTGVRIDLGAGVGDNRITTKIDIRKKSGIAAELSVVCSCKCDTLEAEKHYRLYYE